jgi:hypothetical protein
MKKVRTFMDKEGKVAKPDDPNVYEWRETIWDSDGHLVRSGIYFASKKS